MLVSYVTVCYAYTASQSSTNDTLGDEKKIPLTSIGTSTADDGDHTKSFKTTLEACFGR